MRQQSTAAPFQKDGWQWEEDCLGYMGRTIWIVYTYVCIYIYTHTHIYIYIICVCVCVLFIIYLYIYRTAWIYV